MTSILPSFQTIHNIPSHKPLILYIIQSIVICIVYLWSILPELESIMHHNSSCVVCKGKPSGNTRKGRLTTINVNININTYSMNQLSDLREGKGQYNFCSNNRSACATVSTVVQRASISMPGLRQATSYTRHKRQGQTAVQGNPQSTKSYRDISYCNNRT